MMIPSELRSYIERRSALNSVYRRTLFTSSTLFRMAEIPDGAIPDPPWRTAPRRRSVPRPQLSREVVVEAALQVLEAGGGAALTMRRVADQIGASASSLYGYVANKDELIQLVFERTIEEMDIPSTDDGWQENIKEFGRAMLGLFQRHPGVAELSLGRVPWGPSLLAVGERTLADLRSAGIPDQVAAFAGDLAGLYVGAFAYEQEVTVVPGPGSEARAQMAAWLGALPRDRFPNTVALATELVAGSAEDRFEWGLDVIVRGLASYQEVPPDARARWPSPRKSPAPDGDNAPSAPPAD
jgi:TetR/AcrR family tetracycline transcriptional repressor